VRGGQARLAEDLPGPAERRPAPRHLLPSVRAAGSKAVRRVRCVVDGSGMCGGRLRHIAIDGKAVRSAPQGTFSGCLHLVSAWAAENRLILGQEAVADGSHEIAAIPELLKVLALEGALVTIDAAGCQKEIAKQIRDQGGDYLLAVKGNKPTLLAAVQAAVGRLCDADFEGVDHDEHGQVEDGHGRHEERYVTAIYDPEVLPRDGRTWRPLCSSGVRGR